jgi:hypothetical protein
MRITQDRRKEPRFPVRLPVVYWGDEFLGEGTAVELSRHGLLLIGNYLAVTGTGVRLMLTLPHDPTPLGVTRAVVRWVKGLEVGMELLALPDIDRARLDTFLVTLSQDREAVCVTGWPWEDDGPALWHETMRSVSS